MFHGAEKFKQLLSISMWNILKLNNTKTEYKVVYGISFDRRKATPNDPPPPTKRFKFDE
jgi:hypothetical protein